MRREHLEMIETVARSSKCRNIVGAGIGRKADGSAPILTVLVKECKPEEEVQIRDLRNRGKDMDIDVLQVGEVIALSGCPLPRE